MTKQKKICYDEIEVGNKKLHCHLEGEHYSHEYLGSIAEPLRGGGSKITRYTIQWKKHEMEMEE